MTIQANLRAAYIRAVIAEDEARWARRRLERRMSRALVDEAYLEALETIAGWLSGKTEIHPNVITKDQDD